MKTAEQKAERVVAMLAIDGICFSEKTRAKIKETVITALKEQDRDTRHACAEAVLECHEDVSGQCIWKDDAHNACMNVKSV